MPQPKHTIYLLDPAMFGMPTLSPNKREQIMVRVSSTGKGL
jgi:hypothetical protein